MERTRFTDEQIAFASGGEWFTFTTLVSDRSLWLRMTWYSRMEASVPETALNQGMHFWALRHRPLACK